MGLSADQSERLTELAKRLIESMGVIEASAERALREFAQSPPSSAATVFALPQNTMVGPALVALNLTRIREQGHLELNRIRDEPFIAEVLAENENGQVRRFYISRFSPPSVAELDGQLASYRAPLGKVAEVFPGESTEVKLPGRPPTTFTVLERSQLRPTNTSVGWDGLNNRIEFADLRVSLDSLHDFLMRAGARPAEVSDLLGALLAEIEAAKSVQEGIRRGVVARMSLRDQAILDRYQGEVFRLPVGRRLMLTGPPGTGKTTTLIRRLAQKRNAADVQESDAELVQLERLAEFFHPDNWIMFTPTELLKLYLKEAFAREGIAASDERVRTWADERRRLSRDVLRILRSERGGRFTLDDETSGLRGCHSTTLMALTDAFVHYFERQTMEQYEAALHGLLSSDDRSIAELVDTMRRRAGTSVTDIDALFDFVEFHEPLREQVDRLASETNAIQHAATNTQLARDRSFLDRLADFLETLTADTDEEDDEDETDGEDYRVSARDRRLVAAVAFRRAIFAKAISLEDRRTLKSTSQNARVLEWLADDVPADDVLGPLGAKLARLRRLRFLSGTYRNLVDRVPAIYHRFRRTALRDGLWYLPASRAAGDRNRVAGAEVDIMLLLMLRNARRFLLRRGGAGLREDTRIATLDDVKSQYVTQVLVDEATDFSPVQLACMLELAHPTFRSYFACGDVHQRATRWGVRDLAELNWVAHDFEVREVTVGYRQSRKLAAFAAVVARLQGADASSVKVPDYIDDKDVPPLLAENLAGPPLAQWLSKRITEIEQMLGTVPSIAIFVDGDDKIDRLVNDLRKLLADRNLDVVGCKEGRIVGTDSQIRIFDVQYIKGLEFEAVFFIGLDSLVASHEDLLNNYLFIGVTRAATYLGLTCEGALPFSLESLRPHLSDGGWN